MRKDPRDEILKNASQSCRLLNSAILTPETKKPRSTAIVDAFKGISFTDETPISVAIQNAQSQYHQTPALGSTVSGEAKGFSRTRIRFTGCRVRPLDPDNFAASCKDLLDGCRHAGLIPGDEPWQIIFETEQEKVKSYAEERTLIEIASGQTTVECKDK